jgi:SOS-response transcriptional repressor LexA
MLALYQTVNPKTIPNDKALPPLSGAMSLKLIRIAALKRFAKSIGLDEKQPTALGKVIGKKPQQTANLLSGKAPFGEKVARSIEAEAGLPEGWLDKLPDEKNTDLGPVIRGQVPLISEVQAGMYKEHVDNFYPGDGGAELIPTSVPVKRHTFALRVSGDSMVPEFSEGMILIVEPEMEPNPGDYVIARNGEGETTFKQLIKDGSDWYLKPLNDRYPIKPLGNASIIGVVRAVEKRFR